MASNFHPRLLKIYMNNVRTQFFSMHARTDMSTYQYYRCMRFSTMFDSSQNASESLDKHFHKNPLKGPKIYFSPLKLILSCSSSQPANRLTAWLYAHGSHLTTPPHPTWGPGSVNQHAYHADGQTGQRSRFTCPVYIAT